jgi:hypothetical protein
VVPSTQTRRGPRGLGELAAPGDQRLVTREAKQGLAEQLQYLENHLHRMDYPTYVAQGWQIGSGPVESASKRVVGQRLKGSGMRLHEDGSDTICHLRALFLSTDDQWYAFWSSRAA